MIQCNSYRVFAADVQQSANYLLFSNQTMKITRMLKSTTNQWSVRNSRVRKIHSSTNAIRLPAGSPISGLLAIDVQPTFPI